MCQNKNLKSLNKHCEYQLIFEKPSEVLLYEARKITKTSAVQAAMIIINDSIKRSLKGGKKVFGDLFYNKQQVSELIMCNMSLARVIKAYDLEAYYMNLLFKLWGLDINGI